MVKGITGFFAGSRLHKQKKKHRDLLYDLRPVSFRFTDLKARH